MRQVSWLLIIALICGTLLGGSCLAAGTLNSMNAADLEAAIYEALRQVSQLTPSQLNALGKQAEQELADQPDVPVEQWVEEAALANIRLFFALHAQQQREEQAALRAKHDAEYAASGIRRWAELDDPFMGVRLISTGDKILLGMSVEQVKDILGEPDNVSTEKLSDSSLDTYDFYYEKSGIIVSFHADDTVSGLMLISSVEDATRACELANGLRIGVSSGAVSHYSFHDTVYAKSDTFHYNLRFNQREDGTWRPVLIDEELISFSRSSAYMSFDFSAKDNTAELLIDCIRINDRDYDS